MTMDQMKVTPMAEEPIPRERRQLVATMSPTPVAITLGKPSFFSVIIHLLYGIQPVLGLGQWAWGISAS